MMIDEAYVQQIIFKRNSISFKLNRRKKMKGKILLTFVILAVLTAGCATGKEVSLTDFDKVEIQDGFHVDITVGEEYSVTLNVDDDVLKKIEVVKQGDTLIFRVKPFQDIVSDSLVAEVAMPALIAFTTACSNP